MTAARRAAQPSWWRPGRSPSGLRWAAALALDTVVRTVRQVWWWTRPVRWVLAAAVVVVAVNVSGALLGSFRPP